MTIRRDHFINNEWITGSGFPFASRNPATEEVVWQGPAATDVEVNAAVTAARHALGPWSRLPLQERIDYLEKFKTALIKKNDLLAEAISKETGKPLWESKGEINSMVNKVDISVEAYHQRCGEITKEHPSGKSVTRHKPHGVVAVFGPFNFPGHLPNGHIIPALLAGNTVVLKPSEQAPLAAETIISCWEESGIPPGTINMVQGSRETGRILASHQQIDGLFFTGSWETGLAFSDQFAKHPEKILALEMGGNNPLVVSYNISDLKAAAYTTIQSAFITAGQRCSCARRLIVLKGAKGEEYLHTLLHMMHKIQVGPYTDTPEPYMGPVISGNVARFLLAVQDTLKSKGGTPLREMHLIKKNTALLNPGLIDVTAIPNRLDEEIFGPLLQLIWVDNIQDAIEEANRTVFGLTAGLISDNADEYHQFYQQVRAGIINWNTPLTGANSAAPFGGIGRSGNFRPSAFYAADYCAYPVASLEAKKAVMPKTLPPGLSLEG